MQSHLILSLSHLSPVGQGFLEDFREIVLSHVCLDTREQNTISESIEGISFESMLRSDLDPVSHHPLKSVDDHISLQTLHGCKLES